MSHSLQGGRTGIEPCQSGFRIFALNLQIMLNSCCLIAIPASLRLQGKVSDEIDKAGVGREELVCSPEQGRPLYLARAASPCLPFAFFPL